VKPSKAEKVLRRELRRRLKSESQRSIARAVGCQAGQLVGFARGECDMMFALAGRIADHLGLELR